MRVSFKKKILARCLCLALVAIVILVIPACSNPMKGIIAQDLSEDIKAKEKESTSIDKSFIKSTADFSFDLFKRAYDSEKNSLVSPLSVMIALAMTANGADKATLEQMEDTLAKDMGLDNLNSYLYSYIKDLPSENKSKLSIANSIWIRDDEGLKVKEDFLQRNADYYRAQIYKSPFNQETVSDINRWVAGKTDGMIDKIVDDISPEDIMFIINAIVFDGKWKNQYSKNDIIDRSFTRSDTSQVEVEFMISDEDMLIEDEKAIGFIKPYHNDHYSFVALLPSEDMSIDEYIESLTGEIFVAMLENAKQAKVKAYIPKFEYDYDLMLKDILYEMGIKDAFSAHEADFTRMAELGVDNIYIDQVLHKTFISLDEKGTKAAAVTKVGVKLNSAGPEDQVFIILDRPFVFAIVDNKTKLPIFIGSLMDPAA
jgi:serpin B